MHIFKKFFIVMIVCTSLPAAAEFTTVAPAYEISLADFQAPSSANGSLSFKQCSTCDQQTVRVTNQTRYVLNREQIELSDFRRAIALVRDRSTKTIVVKHHLESDTVISVSISLR